MKRLCISLLLLTGFGLAQDSDFIPADQIDAVVVEQMLEIDRAVIEIGTGRFVPEMVFPDMENGELVIVFNEGLNALFIPVDVINQDLSPQGDIYLSGKDAVDAEPTESYVISEYSVDEKGAGLEVNGSFERDGDTVALRFIYSEALLGAGNTTLEIKTNEAYLSGDLGTKSYAQIKDLISHHPEVDTLVLTQSSGSMNDLVNMHTGRLVRNAGLTTKVLADSDINSGMVDLFAAGAERIYTGGAILGVHSWCCFEDKTAGELPRDHPAHAGQLEYFTEMLGEELGPEFYFYTLESAPFDGIHKMSTGDIERFDLATEILE